MNAVFSSLTDLYSVTPRRILQRINQSQLLAKETFTSKISLLKSRNISRVQANVKMKSKVELKLTYN